MYLFRVTSIFSLTKCYYALASAQQKQKYVYIQLEFITDMIMKQIPTLNAKKKSFLNAAAEIKHMHLLFDWKPAADYTSIISEHITARVFVAHVFWLENPARGWKSFLQKPDCLIGHSVIFFFFFFGGGTVEAGNLWKFMLRTVSRC